jgi:hypothetical protein
MYATAHAVGARTHINRKRKTNGQVASELLRGYNSILSFTIGYERNGSIIDNREEVKRAAALHTKKKQPTTYQPTTITRSR